MRRGEIGEEREDSRSMINVNNMHLGLELWI